MTFPEGFWFGAGASSSATEGTAPASDLAAWEHDGRRRPTGPSGAPDVVAGDLARLAEVGCATVRLTLEWARLEPTEGRRDTEAVEAARLALTTARDAGLDVWACLHDGTLPGWFAHDEHGYADRRARGYHWARHVEFVGETFGDLVAGWVPVFEPGRWALRGWVTGSRPPGRGDDAPGFAEALEGAHLASVEAALRLREGGRPVASAQWLVPLFPARPDPDSPAPAEAQAMVELVDDALWGSWRRMLTEETLSIGHRPPVAVPGAREAFDVLGVTYRHAAAVRGDGQLLAYPQTLAPGPDGQVPWSEGLGLSLHHTAESLPGRPLLVAGYGLTTGDEDRREQHLRDGLAAAAEAVDGGIDLRGFWWDTPIDPVGGTVGPGLFDHDRAPRPAAALFASVARGGPVPG